MLGAWLKLPSLAEAQPQLSVVRGARLGLRDGFCLWSVKIP